jgi:hypothetical protein
MPNSPSPEKRRVTYLENRHVAEWMQERASEEGRDLAELVREATLEYFVAHQPAEGRVNDAQRASEKARARRSTKRRIATGAISPREAQRANALRPPETKYEVVDLWKALRRRAP